MLDITGANVHKGDEVAVATRRGSSSYLFKATVVDLYQDIERPTRRYIGATQDGPVYETIFAPMIALRLHSNGRVQRERQDSYRSRLVITRSFLDKRE